MLYAVRVWVFFINQLHFHYCLIIVILYFRLALDINSFTHSSSKESINATAEKEKQWRRQEVSESASDDTTKKTQQTGQKRRRERNEMKWKLLATKCRTYLIKLTHFQLLNNFSGEYIIHTHTATINAAAAAAATAGAEGKLHCRRFYSHSLHSSFLFLRRQLVQKSISFCSQFNAFIKT